ncbi:GNAT family N-acetyltransferase [Paenibacillus doosanensis]|uniref:Acetyltransferase n=1 Tax=Paenibacillus konkukensis TaxID=2020716 RepID=A0ABY4RW87_9BACL|nr:MULTISPECIES: GNAT family N-acetyltransferase [Paenibacillus]MCS7458895.1 GNAT family N-acetyltransferase [Paenibacillus doosanensis]UQZ86577.1 Acetyltransferase [Paenibacillus konkukensis]
MSGKWHIREIVKLTPSLSEDLSQLLVEVVEDGASVGFLPPLSREEANSYWNGVLQPGILLWAAVMDDAAVGTVQLQLAQKANASHRAEIAKLMVHPLARRKGIAKALMHAAENRAREEGRSLLVLDTREGDASNRLYLSMGYIEAGRIPGYARSADGRLDGTVLYYKTV